MLLGNLFQVIAKIKSRVRWPMAVLQYNVIKLHVLRIESSDFDL